MKKIIACCGLVCTECPAYIATVEDDDTKRTVTAKAWSKQFNVDLKADDINCRGCLHVGDDIFGHCKVCKIRLCSLKKGFSNCSFCSDYPCDNLDEIFKMVPKARETLDELKNSYKKF